MTHLTHENYRHHWDLFKGLLALNAILFKLFLLWIHISLAIH